MDESAESLKDVLVKRLKKDNTYDAIQKNIVGFVSDSASVMVTFHNQILSTYHISFFKVWAMGNFLELFAKSIWLCDR